MTQGDSHGEIVPVRLPPRHDAPAWLAGAVPLRSFDDGPTGAARAVSAVGAPWDTPMPPVRVELVEPPASIRVASWLWIASGACHVGSWLLAAFLDVPMLAADMRADGETAPPDGGDTASAIVLLVFGVLWSLVWAVPATTLAVALRRGRDWARVVLAIGGLLMLLVLGVEVLAGWAWRTGHGAATADVWLEFRAIAGLSAAAAGAVVAACVLMFTASARGFVAAVSRGRR